MLGQEMSFIMGKAKKRPVTPGTRPQLRRFLIMSCPRMFGETTSILELLTALGAVISMVGMGGQKVLI